MDREPVPLTQSWSVLIGVGVALGALVALSGCGRAREGHSVTPRLVAHSATVATLDTYVRLLERNPCDPARVVAYTTDACYTLAAETGAVVDRLALEYFARDPAPAWDCGRGAVPLTLDYWGGATGTAFLHGADGRAHWLAYDGRREAGPDYAVAAGDTDGDGVGELYVGGTGRIVRVAPSGAPLWHGALPEDGQRWGRDATFVTLGRGAPPGEGLVAATRGRLASGRRTVQFFTSDGGCVRTTTIPNSPALFAAVYWPDGNGDLLLIAADTDGVLILTDAAGHERGRHLLPRMPRSRYSRGLTPSTLFAVSLRIDARRHLAVLSSSSFVGRFGVLTVFDPDLDLCYEETMDLARGLVAVPDTADTDALLVGRMHDVVRYPFAVPPCEVE